MPPSKEKETTIIDFLNFLTFEKTKWDDLTLQDQKKFDPYMIIKWLSMESNGVLCPIANIIQKYSSELGKKELYNLLFDILPKEKYFFKYIKANDENSKKYSEKLIEIFSEYFEISKKEAINYLNLYYETENQKRIKRIVLSYNIDEKEVEKILKNND